jgi:hypothetical protein
MLNVPLSASLKISAPILSKALTVITNRSLPLCDVPKMSWGNKPTDGRHFILSVVERAQFLQQEPAAKKFIRPYMSGGDFINDIEHWCLWLADADPHELKNLPLTLARVNAVKEFRLTSKAMQFIPNAMPYHFGVLSSAMHMAWVK